VSFPLVGNPSAVRDDGESKQKDSEQVGMTEIAKGSPKNRKRK
jgi:hypothetical protein